MASGPLSSNPRAYAGVVVGVATVSTAATLIRLAQATLDSIAIAAWRLTLATLILGPLVLITRRAELRALRRRDWAYLLAAGALLALHFATWIMSLAYTSVAASVVLVTTNPLFVGLASHVLLHERLSRGLLVGLIIAFAGSALIGVGDWGQGTHRIWGDVLALAGAMAAAGYFLIGRQLRARLSLMAYVFPVYGVAAMLLLAAAIFSGRPMVPPRMETWVWLLLMALGPQLIGHSALNWALRYLSATYVTIAILGEPVGATVLAWVFLGERPSLWAVSGGLLILMGIAIASFSEQR